MKPCYRLCCGASWNLTSDLLLLHYSKDVRDTQFQLPGYRKLPTELLGKHGISLPDFNIRFSEGLYADESLISAWHIWEKGSSVEEWSLSDWPDGILVGHFLIGN